MQNELMWQEQIKAKDAYIQQLQEQIQTIIRTKET